MVKQTRNLPTFFIRKSSARVVEKERRKGRGEDKVRSRAGENPIKREALGHIWGKKAWSKTSA